MKVGATQANRVLDQLLGMGEGDRVNVLSVAREYADSPSVRGMSMPAGTKLIRQLEFALAELKLAPLPTIPTQEGTMQVQHEFEDADSGDEIKLEYGMTYTVVSTFAEMMGDQDKPELVFTHRVRFGVHP
jgi:hypothetical protein